MLFEQEREALKKSLAGKDIAVVTDEMSDDIGRFVLTVLFTTFDKSSDGRLLVKVADLVFLEKTNHATVAAAVIQKVTTYAVPFDRVVMVDTENASYVKKAFKDILSPLFPNAVHVTCLAHIMNLVGDAFRKPFDDVNEFVRKFNQMFYLAGARKARFLKHLKDQTAGQNVTVTMAPNPVSTRWGCWFDAVLYHVKYLQYYPDFLESEHCNTAPASVKELHATLQNPVKHEAVKVQMSFIAEHCQKLLDLNDRFQSRKPCALKAWDTLHCLQLDLQAFRFLAVEDCTELDEAALDDDHKDVIVECFRKAFVSAEAKVAKYLTTDGQPAADFLKEVRVFDPVATPRMSRNACDYVNIPGFSEVPSDEVWQYFEKFAPEAIAAAITSESGISPDEFWKSVSTNLPQLSALAMRYKDAVTNSADAERSFSMYNLVFSPRRRSLSTENLVALVFLYHNQGVLYDVFDWCCSSWLLINSSCRIVLSLLHDLIMYLDVFH